jgi:hypothetical protein
MVPVPTTCTMFFFVMGEKLLSSAENRGRG